MISRISRRALLSSLGSGLVVGALPGCAAKSPPAPLSPAPGSTLAATPAPPVAAAIKSPFPPGFAWGTATAAYQIEGAAAVDGRGPSVWDVFSKKAGATFEGHTGEVACDHYHRYREDVGLLKQLGARAYRFSVSWTRVLPEGRGAVNEPGVDFYKRLLDELAAANITPYATLFHWDYPQALFQKGGWLARDSAAWFADYASLVVSRLGDRVSHWFTLNEPSIYIPFGHVLGLHAPGLKLTTAESLVAAHNTLRAHGRAVQAIRAAAPPGTRPEIGCALAYHGYHPVSDSADDSRAAAELTFASEGKSLFNNAWWMDPLFKGAYPADGVAAYGAKMPKGFERDLAEIQQPLDFVGLNIYSTGPCRRGADGRPESVPVPQGYPRAASDWQALMPQALYYGPRFVYERYGLPILISENGLAVRDQMFLDGAVHDLQRVDYLQRVLVRLADAIVDGVPVRGYFHWSFLDNFEWADGYKQRFGLVYVDYESQRRIPKDSFAFYRDIIASNGARALAPTQVKADDVTP
jgi:beta-glucosidase